MPRSMVLMLGVDDLETSLNKKQITKNAARSAGRVACVNDPELQREVAAFVAALPYQQRAALLLRLCHKLGYAEIAADLGCAEHETRATVHEVMRSLRAHLGDRICATGLDDSIALPPHTGRNTEQFTGNGGDPHYRR